MARNQKSERERFFEKHGPNCWRCGKLLELADNWERGHTVADHLGGKERLVECFECNRTDGRKQTKIAAKVKRIRYKKDNLRWDRNKKLAPKPERNSWGKPRLRYNSKTGRWDPQ